MHALFLILVLFLSEPVTFEKSAIFHAAGASSVSCQSNESGSMELTIRARSQATFRTTWRNPMPDSELRKIVPGWFGLRIIGLAETGPLVIAVQGRPGGSDDTFETVLVAEANGVFREVLPDRLNTADDDGVYLGHFGHKQRLGLVIARPFRSTDARVDPHRYDIAYYAWHGTGFRLEWCQRTERRFSTARAATRQFGFQVAYDLVRSTVPDFFQ